MPAGGEVATGGDARVSVHAAGRRAVLSRERSIERLAASIPGGR